MNSWALAFDKLPPFRRAIPHDQTVRHSHEPSKELGFLLHVSNIRCNHFRSRSLISMPSNRQEIPKIFH
jgi:hypothetical protein